MKKLFLLITFFAIFGAITETIAASQKIEDVCDIYNPPRHPYTNCTVDATSKSINLTMHLINDKPNQVTSGWDLLEMFGAEIKESVCPQVSEMARGHGFEPGWKVNAMGPSGYVVFSCPDWRISRGSG